MSQSLTVPGRGEVAILSDEEKAIQEAQRETFRAWVEGDAPEDGLVLNWENLLAEGSVNEALAHVGEFAQAFTAARIVRHQFETKEQPKLVQVVVQVLTFDLESDSEPETNE